MYKRIKDVRKTLLLSQAEFGNCIGLSRDTIANIELSRIEVKDIYIKSICNEFNVNEEWLRSGTGEMFKQRTRNQEILAFANDVMEDVDNSFKKRFIRALSKLNVSDWETLEKIAEELSKED